MTLQSEVRECILEQYITTDHIYHGILLGAKNISRYKERLNQANQFPVPDHDTGDNLYYLMTKIRANLEYHPEMKQVLARTSDLAILNSRGNSGAIFSQFFVGFEKDSPREEKIHLTDFVRCFERGYQSAYHSLADPVMEGTILSAIKNWSDSLKKYKDTVASMEKLYELCLAELRITVESSKNYLKKEKKQRFSDAGALAFLYFIEGFMSTIIHQRVDQEKDHLLEEIGALSSEQDRDHQFSSDYRFCTEVLVEKNHRKFDSNSLESQGDCLVVSQNKRYLKIHIHTNRPDRVSGILSEYGRIMESKCDDMKIQRIQEKRGKIALVIDSIADLPQDCYTEDTYMLPMNLLVGNVSFQDKRTVFPRLLDHPHISSSQPSNRELEALLSQLLLGYERVLILTVSAQMSGLHDQYQKLIKDFPRDRIALMDTKLNSVGEGLVVHRALDLIERGKNWEELRKELEKTIEKTRIFVTVKNLKRMIASGRLNHRVGRVLQWIHFLPIITIDSKGRGKMDRFAFSRERNQRRLITTLLKQGDRLQHYSVVHCNDPEGAEAFSKKLEQALGMPPLYISDISSVIKVFSGEGSLAVGYTLK